MADKSVRASEPYTKRLQFFARIPLLCDRDLTLFPCVCAHVRMYTYARDDTAEGRGGKREHVTVGCGVGEATVWGGGVAGLPGGWSTRRCVQPNNL